MASPAARTSPARTSSSPTSPSVRSVAAVLRASFSPTPIAVASRNGSRHCTSQRGRSTRSAFTPGAGHGHCGRCSGPSESTGCSRSPSADAALGPRPGPRPGPPRPLPLDTTSVILGSPAGVTLADRSQCRCQAFHQRHGGLPVGCMSESAGDSHAQRRVPLISQSIQGC